MGAISKPDYYHFEEDGCRVSEFEEKLMSVLVNFWTSSAIS